MQQKLEFKVQGLDCIEEVTILKKDLGPLVGGEDHLGFDVLKGKMTVFLDQEMPPEDLIKAISRAGFQAMPWEAMATKAPDSFFGKHGRSLFTAASGMALFIGFIVHSVTLGGILQALAGGDGESHSYPIATIALYLVAMVFGTWFVLPKAWIAARRLRPDMNLLMLIAVIGAVAIGEWFEAGAVAFLFSLSLTLEAWSVGRARRAVEALLDMTPQTARVLENDQTERECSPEEVEVDQRVLVKPGERIPVDGKVLAGSGGVNQAPITGESEAQHKEPGATVFAGSINGDGALEIQCTRVSSDTTLSRIIKLVEEAQSRRSSSERWVEKFARIYTPIVMLLSALVLLVPPLLFAQDWSIWLYRALVLLVIACPCALVISTPVSIVAALARSARVGVLIKGGLFIEIPARLRAIAFDKTGTLTQGKPVVTEAVFLNGHDESELLIRAAALEARSEHPLGKAILNYAEGKGIKVTPCENFQAIKGKGASGTISGKDYWLGSHRYLEERGQETEDVHNRLDELSKNGQTVVVIGNEEHVCGFIAVSDSLRPEAIKTLRELKNMGIESLVMLTGDNQGTAERIGSELGIDSIQAELLPEDKVAAIEQLVKTYDSVAMIGDGVNDAPAMARSSLSLAMGVAGTDAAIETADVALMSDDLTRMPWLIHHSRRTLAIIQQNIVFALALKLGFIVLTVFGYASLWAAITADMGASLLVIFNGLRLLRDDRRGMKLLSLTNH